MSTLEIFLEYSMRVIIKFELQWIEINYQKMLTCFFINSNNTDVSKAICKHI